VRNIKSFTVNEFQSQSNIESWEEILEGSDINYIFNGFSNIYFKKFYAQFTNSKVKCTHRYNPWITSGIKYCVITKAFCTLVAGEVMIPISNCNTKDTAIY
jgi:hypothetical protein